MTEIQVQCVALVVVWCDNQGTRSLTSNPMFHGKTKHIELDGHCIREQVTTKQLSVQFVPSEFQVADILTKPMSTNLFLCCKIGHVWQIAEDWTINKNK